MVRRTLICLMILSALQGYSQSSPRPSSDSMTCFTESELEAMEVEAAQIMEDAVTEAVKVAVEPYRLEVERLERTIFWWKVGTVAGIVGTVVSLIWAAFK